MVSSKELDSRVCQRREGDDGLYSKSQAAGTQTVCLLLWSVLDVRRLETADFLSRIVGALALTFTLRIAAVLFRLLASEELLTWQAPANREYSNYQSCQHRFVGRNVHLLLYISAELAPEGEEAPCSTALWPQRRDDMSSLSRHP